MGKSDSRGGSVLQVLKGLVHINSVNPYDGDGPGEAELAEHIRQLLAGWGLRTRLQRVEGRRSNVVGTLEGSRTRQKGRSLLLNGHLDTVGVEGMNIDPLAAEVDEKGRLHGRGACDMKGSIASMLCAIKSVVDSGAHLHGDLIFAGVVDEEYKSRGTRALVREYRADSAIVGEPTSLSIGIAHKGYVWVEIETKGKSAHGSVPEKGVDAILNMSRLVSRFPSLERRYSTTKHSLLGAPRLHTSTVTGGTEWSVVPDSCTLRAERRTLPGENPDIFLEELREIARGLEEEDPDFRVAFSKIFEQPPMEVSRDAPIVRRVKSSVQDVMGRQPKYAGLPYWTDAAILLHEGNMPTCLFGPGDIAVAHSADESVPLEEVAAGVRIFEDCILKFCGARPARKSSGQIV